MNNYKIKYLKYKTKYLNLQNGGSKICQVCTFKNTDDKSVCEMCGNVLIINSLPDVPSIDETCGVSKQIQVNQYRMLEYPHAQGDRLVLCQKIEQVFYEDIWTILSPPGNGKCLIYAILESLDIHVDNLVDFLTKKILDFIKINKDSREKQLDFMTSQDELITIKYDDDAEIIHGKLRTLLDDNNLSELFIEILSKSMGINILLLMRDNKIKSPYFTRYYNSESTDPKYLILLNTDGHYMSVFPAGHPGMKEIKITEIQTNNLW